MSNAAQILSRATTVRKVAAGAAVLVGAKEFKGQLDTFIGKYRRSLGECNELKSQLNHLRNDIEEQTQMLEETLPEKISLLKVKDSKWSNLQHFLLFFFSTTNNCNANKYMVHAENENETEKPERCGLDGTEGQYSVVVLNYAG